MDIPIVISSKIRRVNQTINGIIYHKEWKITDTYSDGTKNVRTIPNDTSPGRQIHIGIKEIRGEHGWIGTKSICYYSDGRAEEGQNNWAVLRKY